QEGAGAPRGAGRPGAGFSHPYSSPLTFSDRVNLCGAHFFTMVLACARTRRRVTRRTSLASPQNADEPATNWPSDGDINAEPATRRRTARSFHAGTEFALRCASEETAPRP